ncbi:lipocalin [Vibrio sp. CAIM 722]|uniref:Outer membrane lipoprotein Blc n=1 Tax=Vibrio eleionomae TaxID=2653505 RepID=A0A7X4LLS3_9VIBR|nr:lipocalin family protein [Vibrio eleionomae]MZI93901.1 lipocalin [Vibrio eleionomae]
MQLLKRMAALLLVTVILGGCTGKPDNIEPVTNFDLNKYLGTWYEIARLDHSFERGLSNIQATYRLKSDGTVSVVNRGWNTEEKQWAQAVGKAKFVTTSDIAHLKVSFFGPFYGSYVVFYLADDYSLALVTSYNKDYFWMLSRTKTISKDKLDHALEIAQKAGFDTSKFIYPKQTDNPLL